MLRLGCRADRRTLSASSSPRKLHALGSRLSYCSLARQHSIRCPVRPPVDTRSPPDLLGHTSHQRTRHYSTGSGNDASGPVHIAKPAGSVPSPPSSLELPHKTRRWGPFTRSILWLLVVICLAVLSYQLLTDSTKIAIFRPLIPLLLSNLDRTSSLRVHEALLGILALLSDDEGSRRDIIANGGIEALLRVGSKSDLRANAHIVRILSNLCLEAGAVEKLVAAGLIPVLVSIYGAAAKDDSPFREKQRSLTNLYLARAAACLAQSREHLQALVRALSFASLGAILEEPLVDVQSCRTILHTIAALSRQPDFASAVVKEGGMRFFQSLIDRKPDHEVYRQIARCFANISVDQELAFQLARDGGLQMLSTISNAFPDGDTQIDAQVLRALAHLARDDQLKTDIVDSKSFTFLRACASRYRQEDRMLYLTLVALGNLAAMAECGGVIMHEFNIAGFLDRLSSPEIAAQLVRLYANLAKNERYLLPLYEGGGQKLLETLGKSSDAQLRPSLARLIALLAHSGDVSSAFLSTPFGWTLIRSLSASGDLPTRRNVVRAVAGMAINAAVELKAQPDLGQILRTWSADPDLRIRSDAIRAQASLASAEVKGPKFAEGVYLLHPAPSVPFKNQDFDIVFIHGVAGDPHTTWLGGTNACWPRDWLPSQFPKARVLSLGYGIFLSRWSGDSLPLEEQTRVLQKKLKLAGVGSRPVVFVTHSFGGLVVKQLLKNASAMPEYQPLVENTKGIVFFAVPHLGSELATYADYRVANALFRGSAVLEDIRPSSQSLLALHQEFNKLGRHISTLSFGENDKTCYGTQTSMTCWQVVSDESANPGFSGERPHEFVKLDFNHREVCKPKDQTDMRYRKVVDFIAAAVKAQQQVEKRPELAAAAISAITGRM